MWTYHIGSHANHLDFMLPLLAERKTAPKTKADAKAVSKE
jgi:hypothetical protein